MPLPLCSATRTFVPRNSPSCVSARFSAEGGGGGGGSRGPPPSRAPPGCSLFVEGVPADATERETAHIFRPFHGYRGLRFVPRKDRPDAPPLLFVDYDSPEQVSRVPLWPSPPLLL